MTPQKEFTRDTFDFGGIHTDNANMNCIRGVTMTPQKYFTDETSYFGGLHTDAAISANQNILAAWK